VFVAPVVDVEVSSVDFEYPYVVVANALGAGTRDASLLTWLVGV
jgi:hypothetical protein